MISLIRGDTTFSVTLIKSVNVENNGVKTRKTWNLESRLLLSKYLHVWVKIASSKIFCSLLKNENGLVISSWVYSSSRLWRMEFNSGALPVTGVILVKKNGLNCLQKFEDMGQGGSYKKNRLLVYPYEWCGLAFTLRRPLTELMDWIFKPTHFL